ncbi:MULTISPECIES: hypothetical protein [Streptomyces]|uniref:Uncharacterized protein n=1 Tax=Streptomyces dengpaensis TaxID=2049881 RepID=A0ABM6SPB5_9ACTN|nr:MULTISPECIES: hypothetical protein [Streptomyces]AVH56521.1 hypothetical protein C4B68_12890 [Streptomyces dengpaensis]PIB10454.1 hypothetical protein B1C81_08220 [Streptomyces sp. HG99]
MKSEDTPFVGGPLDGRVLPVLLGLTGHPPKTYRVPVPDADGGPATVLVYRRVQSGRSRTLGLHQGWKYEYDPEGDTGRGLKWPWSKGAARGGATPESHADE